MYQRGRDKGNGNTTAMDIHMDTGGGGGLSGTKGAAPALRISRKKGYFSRPPHARDFVKEGYFLRSMGGENPVTKYTRLRRRVTPEVTGLTYESAAAKQAGL